MKRVTIHTDGACRGNPGPGGYGVVMVCGRHRLELSKGFSRTTNNRMELLATIVALETYPANANALLEPLRRISAVIVQAETEAQPIDALFMPGGQEYLELLARLLPIAKIDTRKVQLIGTGGMDYPNAGRDAALVGAWYPGPDPRGWSEFAQKYAKTYQSAPPRIAGVAHDAMTLAIALAGDPSGQGVSTATLTRAACGVPTDSAPNRRRRWRGSCASAIAVRSTRSKRWSLRPTSTRSGFAVRTTDASRTWKPSSRR